MKKRSFEKGRRRFRTVLPGYRFWHISQVVHMGHISLKQLRKYHLNDLDMIHRCCHILLFHIEDTNTLVSNKLTILSLCPHSGLIWTDHQLT